MRLATTTEQAVLASRERFVSPVVVEVQNVDGTWKTLTNLSGEGFSGLDFFRGASWTNDVDAPMWTGSVDLAEGLITATGSIVSIAPDVESSPANVDDVGDYAPLIDGMRRIRWSVTTKRLDGSDSTTKKMFDGYIVSSSQQGALTLQVADLGYLLLTTQVEDERIYGSDDGEFLDDVIQQILDDNMGVGVIPLVTDTTSFGVDGVPKVKKFNFARPRLLTGIRDFAQNTVGANVRYMWNDSGEMEFRLFMPPRDKTTPDFEFGADNYEAIPKYDRNTEDVRNVGRLYYKDSNKKAVVFVAGSVPDSVARYGRRYFEFRESATSQVGTEPEAQKMIDLALIDLAFPKAEKQFTTPFAWAFDVYDLFNLVANGKQYTSDQLQSVTRLTHTLGDAKSTRTQFETRGTIAGFYNNWLIREGTGPKAPEVDSLFLAIGMSGEGSMYGGELFDGEVNGAVYPYFFAGKNIRRIHMWARENAPGTLVPEWPPTGSDVFKAGTIERPEGRLSTEGNFVWPGFGATVNPDDPYNGLTFWRTFQPIPTGRRNQPVIRTVIVKPETFDGTFGAEQRLVSTAEDAGGSSEPGTFADISITRTDATTVTIEYTLPVSSSPWPAPIFMRDGIVIELVDMFKVIDEQGALGAGPYVWIDDELHADKVYRYAAFLWNGVSGPRTLVTLDPWGTAFGFATNTPRMAFPAGGPRVEIGVTGAPVGTDTVAVEKSKDSGQYDPWTQATRRAVGDFPFYDTLVKAGQYYRLVAYDSGGAVLDRTLPFFWRTPLLFKTGV